MKRLLIVIFILGGVLICSWHHQAYAQYRKFTLEEAGVLSEVERVGNYKNFEKEIFKNVKALFGEKGERSNVLERKLL